VSQEELIRLWKLNWYCPKERLAERAELRLKAGKSILQLILPAAQIGMRWIYIFVGWVIVFGALAAVLNSPISGPGITVLVIGAIFLFTLVPPGSRLINRLLTGWPLVGFRAIFMCVGLIVISSQLPEVEEARRSTLSIDERQALEQRDQDRAARAAAESARQRSAEASKRREAESKSSRKKDVAIIDREQRDFYDTLGAPKLLYRCSSDQPLRAVGATRGSINAILQSAQSECSSSSFEIVKRKDN